MLIYTIQPKAPLVFRSGRPFGEGSRDGANFPWPSSIAGMLRTTWMDQAGLEAGKLDKVQPQNLLAKTTLGPFLARNTGTSITAFVPKPADSILLVNANTVKLYRLQPGSFDEGCGSDLPEGMLPVVIEPDAPLGKPQPGASFWPLDTLLQWMRGIKPDAQSFVKTDFLTDTRTSVSIDRNSFAAAEGKLFQVQGLDLSRVRSETGGFSNTDWCLLAGFSETLASQVVTLGGERRMSWLEANAQTQLSPLKLPPEHAKALNDTEGVVITLATPAVFTYGWKPAWLDANFEGMVPGVDGLKVKLRSAAIERWQGISGWDLLQQAPKLARKAVAAGATYWFEIVEKPSGDDWVNKLWLAPLSDDEQDRRDGFGLAVPGPWKYETPIHKGTT